eukprot:1453986-Rhodomonas_salina.1
MDCCKPAGTPLQPNVRLSKDDCPDFDSHNKVLGKQYQQIMGALQYLTNWTHCELAHPVGKLSSFLVNPGPTHMEQAKHVLRYLSGSLDKATPTLDTARLVMFCSWLVQLCHGNPRNRTSWP